MTPILYNVTGASRSSMEICGYLTDAIECTVEEELNGVYQLHMVYPINGAYASELKTMRAIGAIPADGKKVQIFDIFRITMPRYDRLEVEAKHVSYRLSKAYSRPFSAYYSTTQTVQNLFNKMVNYSRIPGDFTFSSQVHLPLCWVGNDLIVSEPTSVRSIIGKVLDIFQIQQHAEMEWDNFDIKLTYHRGAEKNVIIRYGTNLIDYKQEENIEETITGILPYWKGRDADGSDIVFCGTLRRSANYSEFPYERNVPMDFSDKFKTIPSSADLNAAADEYIENNNLGVPKVSINVSFVDLSQTTEYKDLAKIYSVNLADIITVQYESLGVSVKAEIIRTVYDVLKERYTEISIGDAKIRNNDKTSKAISNNTASVKELRTETKPTYASGTVGSESVMQNANMKNCKLVKQGKSVRCYVGIGYANGTTVIPANTTMFTIPTGYRPSSKKIFPGVGYRSNGIVVGPQFEFNTDGTITHNSGTDLTLLYGSAEWEVS